jgi:hypothetical protein
VSDLVRQLDDPAERWRALRRLASRGEEALPAVTRLTELLRDEDVLTRRLAVEALGNVGPAAGVSTEDMLRFVHGLETDEVVRFLVERALERIGGWTRFTHQIPEEITFLERPFLKVVQAAAKREWLKREDAVVAERCWRETLAHACRLETDRVYRLGEQAHAFLAQDHPFEFEVLWSPPFLICASDATGRPSPFELAKRPRPDREVPLAEIEAQPRRFEPVLAASARVAQAVHANLRREYGETLDLRPLEDEFGGRPDYARTVRSYAEGHPIVLWVWTSDRAFTEAGRTLRTNYGSSVGMICMLPMGGRPVQVVAPDAGHIDPERVGFASTTALLYAWRRQANNWRYGGDDALWNPLWIGLCADQAGRTSGDDAHPASARMPEFVREAFAVQREVMSALKRPEPAWMPVAEHLKVGGYNEVAFWLQKQGLNPNLASALHRGQSYAFVRWLSSSPDPRHREALVSGLRALLKNEDPTPAMRAALGVVNEDDWDPIDAAFREWLRVETAAPAAEPANAGTPPR